MADVPTVPCALVSMRHSRRRPAPVIYVLFAARAMLLIALGNFLAASSIAQAGDGTQPDSRLIASQVVDAKGQPVAGARVRNLSGKLLGVTDASGQLTIPCPPPCPVTVEAGGFATRKLLWRPASPVTLEIAAIPESVSVTAYRAPLGEL